MRARSAARFTAPSTPGRRFSTFSMRAAQAAQVMPVSSSSTVAGGTEKPAFSMASTTRWGVVSPPLKATLARSAARFTLASTPGRRLSTFSMRAEQAAQVMPAMGRSRREEEGAAGDWDTGNSARNISNG